MSRRYTHTQKLINYPNCHFLLLLCSFSQIRPICKAAGPPLAGLVKTCLQGVVLASIATFAVKVAYVDPQRRGYKEYYEKHP